MQIPIHGYGAVSAAGTTFAEAAATYATGRTSWRTHAATGLPVYPIVTLPDHSRIAAFLDGRSVDRAALLALHAADRAVEMAGWWGEDFAVLVGCSRGPTESWEAGFSAFAAGEPLPPRTSPQTTLGSLGFTLADYFSLGGLASSLSVTCSSGFHALYHGVALLRAGMAERVLVGGSEAPLTDFTLRQLQALRIYAPLPPPGHHACWPLSESPPGLVIGEGAAFLALSLADGDAGGPVLLDVAATRERTRTATGISPGGEGLRRAMRAVLTPGGRPDRIVAHAPGTRRGDAAERAAIAAVFGPDAPPVTSYKWATGHTFGASGPLATVAALGAAARGHRPQTVLINATGFGGNAVSLLVRSAEQAAN